MKRTINNSPFVIVRTYSAGVFAGNLSSRDGKEVHLENAIRIWYWKGAASLSQLAVDGPQKPNECKFGIPISVILTEAIEIISVSSIAEKKIKGVIPWRA